MKNEYIIQKEYTMKIRINVWIFFLGQGGDREDNVKVEMRNMAQHIQQQQQE